MSNCVKPFSIVMFDLITCLHTVFTNILAKKRLIVLKLFVITLNLTPTAIINAQAAEDMTTAVPDRLK